MAGRIIDVGNGFYNLRGVFKFLLIDIGTQASLVRLDSGRFVMLDTIELADGADNTREVMRLTEDGKLLEAIVNVHPFHTVYVRNAHARFPNAKLYGTARHVRMMPDLPWQPQRTESDEFRGIYTPEIEFSPTKGLYLEVPGNQNIHAGSVFAYHTKSHTLHVVDTFYYLRHAPLLLRIFGFDDSVGFTPVLSQALEPRPGAAREFRTWLRDIITRWDIQNICAAHNDVLLASENKGKSPNDRMLETLERFEPSLAAHEAKYPPPPPTTTTTTPADAAAASKPSTGEAAK